VARIAFWLTAFITPFLFMGALDATLIPNTRPAAAPLREAEFLVSNASRPEQLPADDWRHVRLGFEGPRAPRGAWSSGWFRLAFERGQNADGLWAVYLPRASANVAVFVDGELIGDGGAMTAPLPMYRAPLRFNFPAKLLRADGNRLDVRVVSDRWGPSLNRIYVAPAELVEPAFLVTRAAIVNVKLVTVVVMYVVAVIMAAMFLLRRRDAAFGWFALALAMWAIHIQFLFTVRAWFEPRQLWENLQGFAIGAYSICAAMFVHRFLGIRRPRLEAAFFTWGAFGLIVLTADPLLFGDRLRWFGGAVWVPVIDAIGVYQFVLLLQAGFRRPDLEVRLLAAVSWLVIVIGIRDGLIDFGVVSGRYLYLTYTAIPVLVVFGAILLRRFVNALDASERAKEVLEGRVAEKSRELELNLVRLKDLERERALSAERERIMQDIHDGIGGHLVQALSIAASRAELAPVEEPLRTCLDELRIMIDSIEPVDGDLGSVLGTLRLRMSRRLAQAGVILRWQVGDIPAVPNLGPQHVLEITRILQEAITNAMKHAGARSIAIRAQVESVGGEAQIAVEIADDGGGFGARPNGEGTGRGISGMHRRAESLGGRLHVATDTSGTTVRLELPLRAAPSKATDDEQAREHGQPTGVVLRHSGS
jgi:signal transduction histidine kinase